MAVRDDGDRHRCPLAELHEQSVTNALSGILNRCGFFEIAGTMVHDATSKLPYSVLLLDIDHFKKVNDTFGHQIGDQVIRNVADMMHSNAPETAVIGRLGGGEFAIVLPNTGRRAAFAFAEALRMSIYRQSHSGIPEEHPITVSIGLAEGTGGQLEELLHDADMPYTRPRMAAVTRSGGRSRGIQRAHNAYAGKVCPSPQMKALRRRAFDGRARQSRA